MDIQIFRAINTGWHSTFLDYVFTFFSYTGLGAFAAILAIVLVLKRETRTYAVSIGLAAFMGGTAVAQTFKSLIPRERPSLETYAIVQEKIYHSSFPSGHTATAFAVATAVAILAARKGRWWLFALVYVWAIGVGLSRIYRGVHWPTDVLGGALGGIVGGCLTILIVDAAVRRKSTPA